MTRKEMNEALYHMMKDVMSPGSAQTLANNVMKLLDANGLPTEVVEVVEAPAVVETPEDPVVEVTATVVKAEKARKEKKSV